MHLAGVDFRTAVAWLEQHLAAGPLASGESTAHAPAANPRLAERPGTLRLPVPDDRLLGRVRQYLTRRRRLAASLLEPLIQSGKLYADRRGNAVFLLVAGKAQRPVGAELRGTGPRVWRGMAPGTRKDLGYFWIGAPGSREIVLCESAIDAISCFQMHPQRICISTSGVRSRSSLARRPARPRLRPPLRLRRRRPRRRRGRPHDRPPPRRPPPAAARPRLERRPRRQPLAIRPPKPPAICPLTSKLARISGRRSHRSYATRREPTRKFI